MFKSIFCMNLTVSNNKILYAIVVNYNSKIFLINRNLYIIHRKKKLNVLNKTMPNSVKVKCWCSIIFKFKHNIPGHFKLRAEHSRIITQF